MNKTKIPWADYTINPVKGLCPTACSYCYARRLYKRFKWNPEIRYTAPGFTIAELQTIKKPARIFVGSTMELFLDWPEIWLRDTFTIIRQFPHHTFIFLTKQPQNLIKWSPFPQNVWVGTSITQCLDGIGWMADVKASIKFISFEPLFYYNVDSLTASELFRVNGIKWVIIGQQTPVKTSTMPKIEWVRGIIDAADSVGVPVFLKDNMMALLKDCVGSHAPYWRITDPDNIWPYACLVQLRQEFPNGCGK